MFYEEEEKKDRHQKKTREGNSIFDSVDENWSCPSCKRKKGQILRSKGGKKIGGLHRHHDHAVEWDERNENDKTSFQETVICDQCNHAEGMVKKMYPGVIPDVFSFSPEQIGKFVLAKPNRKHRVRFMEALELFFSLTDISLDDFKQTMYEYEEMESIHSHALYKNLVRNGYPPSLYLEKTLSGEVVSNNEIKTSGSLIPEEEEDFSNFRY